MRSSSHICGRAAGFIAEPFCVVNGVLKTTTTTYTNTTTPTPTPTTTYNYLLPTLTPLQRISFNTAIRHARRLSS